MTNVCDGIVARCLILPPIVTSGWFSWLVEKLGPGDYNVTDITKF